ncbi:hypothetical protein DV515_00005397, partial [Chloebia gouldiae]
IKTLSYLVLLVLMCESVASERQAEKLEFYEDYDLVSLAVKNPCYRRWNERWDFCVSGTWIVRKSSKLQLQIHSELMMGQGLPGNQMKIWKYHMLINSSELYGKYFCYLSAK